MDQRVAFIADWLRDEWSMTELAERYTISRKTAYKWVNRYQTDPIAGLADQSRAPHAHGRRTPAEVAAVIVALRRRYPRWGPKKLRAILAEQTPTRVWPAHDGGSDPAGALERAAASAAVHGAVDGAVGGGAAAQ